MINPMFSRKMVLELEDVVQEKAANLLRRMDAGILNKEPLDLHHAFRSVSVDVITDYAFDRSYNLLDTPDLGANFFALVRGVGPAMWMFQQFPSLQQLALKTPPWLAPYLSEPLGHVTKMQMVSSNLLAPHSSHILTNRNRNALSRSRRSRLTWLPESSTTPAPPSSRSC